MKEARLFLAGVLLLTLLPSLTHASLYKVGSLNFSVATDGNVHVTQTLTDIDVLTPSINATIYAKTPQNFVITDTSGQFVHYSASYYYPQYTNYTIDTLGDTSVLIQYDTTELTSQKSGVWNFTINTAFNYTLILPAGVTAFPSPTPLASSQDNSGQTILTMPSGTSHVSYIFGSTSGLASYAIPLIGGILGISGGSIATYIMIRRNRHAARKVDAGKVMRKYPNLRAEEQDVVGFLAQKGGVAMESEVREAFEKIPKTTIWRLLKRLEEAEVLTLEKVGNQNRVRLR